MRVDRSTFVVRILIGVFCLAFAMALVEGGLSQANSASFDLESRGRVGCLAFTYSTSSVEHWSGLSARVHGFGLIALGSMFAVWGSASVYSLTAHAARGGRWGTALSAASLVLLVVALVAMRSVLLGAIFAVPAIANVRLLTGPRPRDP
jgi:hypothetical protein